MWNVKRAESELCLKIMKRLYNGEAMSTIKITGKVNSAICYAKVVEDEAPMAYKGLDDIIEIVRESVDIIDVLKPVYNFKSDE